MAQPGARPGPPVFTGCGYPRGLIVGFFSGFTVSGCQPAIVRAHSRALALSAIPGNSLRSSTAADNSPQGDAATQFPVGLTRPAHGRRSKHKRKERLT
jgi:hypothetical protein